MSFGKDDYFDQPQASSSKRTKTRHDQRPDATDFEIDHDVSLEPAKQRRGAVAKDAYVSDDEEVGGAAFSSDSEDDSDDAKKSGAKADDEDFDMFSSEAVDETPNKGKKKQLGMDDIEGQELQSRNVESDEEDDDDNKGNRLTAFNMKEEMEQGNFDAQGNYTRNEKDPEAFHDKWMEGISKKEMAKAKQAQLDRDRAEQVKEASRQSTLPQTQAEVYRVLVEYLLPGESVKDALTSLGSAGGAKVPAWKQKLLAKKNKNKKPMPVLDEQQVADRQQKVEAITGLADQLMALGHFGVYDDTLESMVRYLRSKCEVDETWVPQSAHRR